MKVHYKPLTGKIRCDWWNREASGNERMSPTTTSDVELVTCNSCKLYIINALRKEKT